MSLMKSKIHEPYEKTAMHFKTYLDGEQSSQLSEEELDWYANAYRNVQKKRDSMMEIENLAQYAKEDDENDHISSLLDEKRDELIAICAEVVHFIDNTLFQNLEKTTREFAFALALKGDFLRYAWEVSSHEITYKQASEAYFYAMGMCQWNFEPTDIFLLQVAMNYTIHLMNANNIDKAEIILTETINDALKYLEDHDPNNKQLVESLLKNLKENLTYFQEIANEIKTKKLLELEVDEYFPEMEDFEEIQTETEPDDTVLTELD